MCGWKAPEFHYSGAFLYPGGVSSFSHSVTQMALERSSGRCERCGKHVASGRRGAQWSAHHRHPAGMGGSSVDWVYEISNCLILCGTGTTGCHGWVESHRDLSREAGWLVPSGVQLPAEIPVLLWDGRVRLLSASGEYSRVDQPVAILPVRPGRVRVRWE